MGAMIMFVGCLDANGFVDWLGGVFSDFGHWYYDRTVTRVCTDARNQTMYSDEWEDAWERCSGASLRFNVGGTDVLVL